MKQKWLLIVLAGIASGLVATAWAMGKMKDKEQPNSVMPAMAAAQPMAAPMATAHFMCPKCHVLSETAGKCPKCEGEMMGTHVLAVKGGMAYCCGCSDNCKCKGMALDMTKCSCGKDIAKVDIKGKYVCACKDPDKCPSVSDKPGDCMCKKPMVQAE
ncbi:MAG: hypothetical protein NTY53_26445 [Kiritimatiellaeota bacterium]|nr:hypothetical protein [Kiritimatiellota bacterium]